MPPLPPRSTLFPYTTLFRSFRPEQQRAAQSKYVDPTRLEGIRHVQNGLHAFLQHVALGRRERFRIGFHHFERRDRKSTRLNSSHMSISYAVFCLKKKKKK